MKHLLKLLSTLLLACCCTAGAATYYKSTLTLTSVPPNNASANIGGSVRWWFTSVTNPATQVAVTNTIQAAWSNLYAQCNAYGFTNVNAVKLGTNDAGLPTNVLVFESVADRFVSITLGSNWGTVAYSTNAGVSFTAVRVPHTSEAGLVQTQVVTGVVNILSDTNATNKVSATAPALNNYLGQNATVATYTNKSFRNPTNYNGYQSGGTINGATVQWSYFVATNFFQSGAFFIDDGAFRIYTDGGAEFNYKWGAIVDSNSIVRVGDIRSASNNIIATVLYSNLVANGNWIFNGSNFFTDILFVDGGAILNDYIYQQDDFGNVWGFYPGEDSTVTRFMDFSPAQFSHDGTNIAIASGAALTNISQRGVTTNAGSSIDGTTNITLTSGNNLLIRPHCNIVIFGPTAGAANLNNITNGHGNGDWLLCKNETGYNLTLVPESGFLTVPSTMLAMVGGTNGTTIIYPEGWFMLRWLSSNSRWNVAFPENRPPVMTNYPTLLDATNIANAAAAVVSNAVVNIMVTNRSAGVVSGAGSGSTNYLLTISTNSVNDFYMGSSNVNLYAISGGTLGQPVYWNAIITNLSANTWGISFHSGTNRWRFSGTYGTNAPTVLTNNTALLLSGRSDGTNTLVGYTWFAPGL